MSMDTATRTFADNLFEKKWALDVLDEELLVKALAILGITIDDTVPFEELEYDPYDGTILLLECLNNFTLTPEQQQGFWDLGFFIIQLCYCNLKTLRYFKNGH